MNDILTIIRWNTFVKEVHNQNLKHELTGKEILVHVGQTKFSFDNVISANAFMQGYSAGKMNPSI